MNAAPDRPENTVDPKLLEILVCPLTKGPARIRFGASGADLAFGQARLSDSRRHPDHAARGSAQDRMIPLMRANRGCTHMLSRCPRSLPQAPPPRERKFASARSMRGCRTPSGDRTAAGRAADRGLRLDRSRRQRTADQAGDAEEAFGRTGRARHRHAAFDKRGAGGWKPEYGKPADFRFKDYVDDAAALVSHLRAGGKFSKVIVIGHSEGGLVGISPRAAFPSTSSCCWRSPRASRATCSRRSWRRSCRPTNLQPSQKPSTHHGRRDRRSAAARVLRSRHRCSPASPRHSPKIRCPPAERSRSRS